VDNELLAHIIDIKETLGGHTEAIKGIQNEVSELRAECPVWEVKTRVEKLESDQRWYTKIIGVVGGFIGAVTVVAVEWLFHKKG